ncbi:MAG: hypothetical protein WDO18_02905 [Acidobacteriota bacterium]
MTPVAPNKPGSDSPICDAIASGDAARYDLLAEGVERAGLASLVVQALGANPPHRKEVHSSEEYSPEHRCRHHW